MRFRWPAKLLVLTALAFFVMSFAGYDLAFYRKQILRQVKVTIDRVEVEPNVDMLAGIGEAVVMLDVWNPYPVGVTLASGQFALSLGDKEVGMAVLAEGQPHVLQGRSHNRFPVRVEMDLAAALPELKSEVSGALSEMRLRDLGGLVRTAGSGRFGKILEKLQVRFRADGEFVLDTPIGNGIRIPVRALSRAARAAEAGSPPEPAQPPSEPIAVDGPAERRW